MKRVCLLTGASGTLGTAFCRAHAEKYDIAAVYRTRIPEVTSQLQRLIDPTDVTELAENSHPIFAIRADLTQEAELERVVEITLARFNRIDLVIHAAARTSMGPILGGRALLETTETQLRMNVAVPLRLASLIAEQFWKRDQAANRALNRSWINVSSIAGTKVYRGSGQSVYGASKAAMNMLTRHMADEFQTIGIRVNAIAPNTFPRIVGIDRVLSAIRKLDEGEVTGKIQVLDRGASTLI
jgi:NAD(P)-dependent dehydrogenase (short-subunit alcohol dehydrogenase family)